MNAVVTVKSIKVFGDSKEYPAEEVTMKKFVKWATETKADLRAHPILNEQLRVLGQCIVMARGRSGVRTKVNTRRHKAMPVLNDCV